MISRCLGLDTWKDANLILIKVPFDELQLRYTITVILYISADTYHFGVSKCLPDLRKRSSICLFPSRWCQTKIKIVSKERTYQETNCVCPKSLVYWYIFLSYAIFKNILQCYITLHFYNAIISQSLSFRAKTSLSTSRAPTFRISGAFRLMVKKT